MIVIVTGASKGIGRAVAERFAAEGYTIVICARNAAQLQACAAAITAQCPQSTVQAKAVDMSVKNEVIAFGRWVLETFGQPGILVNNAGSFLPGSIHTEEDGVIEEMISTNLYSAYYLTRVLLPAMMEQKSGHIFNMCSIASLQAYANGGSYSISKFALAGFSKNLREELKQYNIKVTAVYPGAVYTDSWSGSGVKPERIMQPADVAELIYTVSKLSPQACVEDIVLRPQLGDL
jgi:short-subunit dehydrogenase